MDDEQGDGCQPSPPRDHRLERTALPADTVTLARYLIGKTLVREHAEGRLRGRIVETEAYPPGDAAGHAFRGRTPRNRSLFLERGHAYVHIAYGIYTLLNVSSERAGLGGGVLLRAIEPLDGIEIMERLRGPVKRRDLARGPGRLAAAFGIDLSLDGLDLCAAGPLWLGAPERAVREIGVSVRIGITHDVERPLRFYERGSLFVSGPRQLNR